MGGLSERLNTPQAHLILIFLLAVPLYMLNARWGVRGNPDAIAAALPAHQYANEGNLDVSGYPQVADNLEELDKWFIEKDSGEIVSNRAPGLIWISIPMYAAIGQESFSNAPATFVALLTTLLAVILTWRVLIRLVGLNRATVAALTLALGTTTWWVSSSELWPHGPGQLWAALAILSLSHSLPGAAGIAFGLSVLTRPLTVLFGAITGIAESLRQRALEPAAWIGSLTVVGVAVVIMYNRVVFERWTVRGGYKESFTTGALERFRLPDYLQNVWEMFLGLPNGFLTTSPILLLAVVGAVWFWSDLPGWTKSLAAAGFGYLLLHAALNRASGGSIVFYRYPLEAIILAAPLFSLGASRLWDRGKGWQVIVASLIGISIALQFAHVFLWSCSITDPIVPTCLL